MLIFIFRAIKSLLRETQRRMDSENGSDIKKQKIKSSQANFYCTREDFFNCR